MSTPIQNNNNPTKQLLAGPVIGSPYGSDQRDSKVPNNNPSPTVLITAATGSQEDSILRKVNFRKNSLFQELSTANYDTIDDMLIFNDHIDPVKGTKKPHPSGSLVLANISFNIFNLSR